MLRKLLVAILLLLHIGLCFAINSEKLNVEIPFSFKGSIENTSVPFITDAKIYQTSDIANIPLYPVNTNTSTELLNIETDTLIGNTKKYLDNLSKNALTPLTSKLYKYGEFLRKASLRLFLYLFGFSILWRFIKFLGRGEYDLKLWLLDTALMVIFMQIAMYMIKNADLINIQIINWFISIGGEATGLTEINPSKLLDLGLDYFIAQVKFVVAMNFSDLLKGLLLMSISGITAFTLGLMVILYLKALIESIIVAQFSVLFLGFLGLDQTREIGTRPIFQWINIGVKLMFLQMMLGLEYNLLKDFIHMDEINVASAISVLFVSVFMLLITWEIPQLFEKIITGSTAINGLSQQAVSSLNNLVGEMKKGGLTGNIARGAFNAGVGTAQNIGGVQRALQTYENYKSSQASNSSAGINSERINSNPISTSKNSEFASTNDTSNNNSSDINSIRPIGTNPISTNTSSNNTQSASTASSQTSSQQASTSSSINNSSTTFDKVKGFSAGIKDMVKDKYNAGVNKTIAGRLAQHFDNKTKENNAITDKASIDAFYKNMWSNPAQQNVNTILEAHEQDKEDK